MLNDSHIKYFIQIEMKITLVDQGSNVEKVFEFSPV